MPKWAARHTIHYQQVLRVSCKALHGDQMFQYPLSWNARADLKKNQMRLHVPRFILYHSFTITLYIPSPYLGNSWTDRTEIWCVDRGLLAMCFTQDGRFFTNARVTVTHLSTSIRSRSFIAQKASYWLRAGAVAPACLFENNGKKLV